MPKQYVVRVEITVQAETVEGAEQVVEGIFAGVRDSDLLAYEITNTERA